MQQASIVVGNMNAADELAHSMDGRCKISHKHHSMLQHTLIKWVYCTCTHSYLCDKVLCTTNFLLTAIVFFFSSKANNLHRNKIFLGGQNFSPHVQKNNGKKISIACSAKISRIFLIIIRKLKIIIICAGLTPLLQPFSHTPLEPHNWQFVSCYSRKFTTAQSSYFSSQFRKNKPTN